VPINGDNPEEIPSSLSRNPLRNNCFSSKRVERYSPSGLKEDGDANNDENFAKLLE
jgi:hypothetical protein